MNTIATISLLAVSAGTSLAVVPSAVAEFRIENGLLRTDPPEKTGEVYIVKTVLGSDGADDEAVVSVRKASGNARVVTTPPTTVFELSQENDGESFMVKVENGKVVKLVYNGENIPENRYKYDNDKVIILDSDGEVLHEQSIHMAGPDTPDFPRPPQIRRFGQGGNFVFNNDDDVRFFTDNSGNRVTWDFQPRVMVGINQGVPSAALRYQLSLDQDQPCILIERVIEGLPAEAAGLEQFDIVVKADGKDADDGVLRGILSEKNPGDEIAFSVIRKGKPVEVIVQLEAFDSEKLSSRAQFFDNDNYKNLRTVNPGLSGWPVAPGSPHIEMPETPDAPGTMREFIINPEDFKNPEKLPELIQRLQDSIRINADRLQLDGNRLMILDEMPEIQAQLEILRDQAQTQAGEALKDAQGLSHRVLPEAEARFDEIESRLSELEDSLADRLERLFDRLDSISEQLKDNATDSQKDQF